ncbi:uncharacterized mitochondrial protein AtMg00820-like [Humulus lupulus]|uniref:uncharacterized mitochondrial protein AtMg00820-like n=1 Tax=Humulus lupulus TaxID=3486 RepID=UPI002B4110F3|nr:uncharacterized mitochondrial protein AtMg00820-like [Humulus lupulus]
MTQIKCGIQKPKAYVSHPTNDLDFPPKSYEHALGIPHWKKSMEYELNALRLNSTWVLVPPPTQANIIDNKCLFKVKYKLDGTIDRHKARLITRGFTQTLGVDYFGTFSLVMKPGTIRVILTLALSKGWPL